MKIRPLEAELFHADGRTDRQMDGEKDMKKVIFVIYVESSQ